MEKTIAKFKKLGTVNLIAKLEKASGEDLIATEVVLVTRNQPFKPSTDIETISELTGITPSVLVEKGYYTEKQAEAWYSGEEYNPEEDPDASDLQVTEEKPKGKKTKKDSGESGEPKVKKGRKVKNPKQLTSVEYAILSAIVKSDYQESENIVGNRIWAISLEDVDQSVVTNGARLAGGIKTLVRRGFITHDFNAVTEAGKTESTMSITQSGYEAYLEKDVVEFKGIIKKFEDLDEDVLESLDLERMKLKKEYAGKYVEFNLNVTGKKVTGLVTGAKLDKRTGYIYLNIRVGRETFNKREKNVSVTEEAPEWLVQENKLKAAKAEEKARAKAKREAERKAKTEAQKIAKDKKIAVEGLNQENADNEINDLNEELMS